MKPTGSRFLSAARFSLTNYLERGLKMSLIKKMFLFGITMVSGSDKSHGLTTIRSDRSTCPPYCLLKKNTTGKNGCYGDGYFISPIWDKCAYVLTELLRLIRKIPPRQMVRLWEVGDFPGTKGRMDKEICLTIAKALRFRKTFGFTHYRPSEHNLPIIQEMGKYITVNMSANSIKEADKYLAMGLDTVLIVHEDSARVFLSPEGNKGVMCPAQTGKCDGCISCGNGNPLCARQNRGYFILLKAHGVQKSCVNKLTEGDLIKQIPILK
jgi:hypothetical protein